MREHFVDVTFGAGARLPHLELRVRHAVSDDLKFEAAPPSTT